MRCRHGEDRDECDACYADDCARADLSRVSLSAELAELDATSPQVKVAAERLNHEMWRITRGRIRG